MTAAKIYWLSVIADGVINQPLVSEDIPAQSLTALILDADNNVVTDATNVGTVTISTGPSGAVLSGTVVAAAVNGNLTFSNLQLDRSGTFNLRIDSPGLEGSTNSTFEILGESDETPPSLAWEALGMFVPGFEAGQVEKLRS